MLLYHGSYTEIPHPDLEHSRPNLDFGAGFYVTPLREQADKWSMRFKRAGKSAVVSIYEFDDKMLNVLDVLKFDEYSEEWLDFILECRGGNDRSSHDIVVGGIANDRVFDTIELFFDELIDKTEAIKRLKFQKPNLQMCFRTEQAISNLRYLGSEEL